MRIRVRLLTLALFGLATLRVASLRAEALALEPAEQAPTPTVVDSPTVKVLTGLLAPEFQEEMNHMVQALGVTCGTCHVRGNFASDDNPKKVTARRMLEMTKAINTQFFPDHKPKPGESVLGRVTCYTCHQGEATPKLPPGL
jgi:photosynthetic reaction center cytochrome c subunit